jgi:hypothetical protein
MMTVPFGKLFLLTTPVSKASWLSGSTEKSGTFRSSRVDTFAGPAIFPPL